VRREGCKEGRRGCEGELRMSREEGKRKYGVYGDI